MEPLLPFCLVTYLLTLRSEYVVSKSKTFYVGDVCIPKSIEIGNKINSAQDKLGPMKISCGCLKKDAAKALGIIKYDPRERKIHYGR